MSLFIENVARTFRLADAIDIGIVAVLIYAVISWVQARSARSIAIPLVAVVAVYWLARWLDLYLTTTIFQYGLLGAFFLFVVVFQQDIRREIERLSTWTSSRPQPCSSETIADSIVEAVAYMAERKIGALIVLPGDEPLDRHVRGGVAVDAEFSLPLVCSIFHSASPGHDGAMTVDGDRIKMLGLHLPLSADHSQIPAGGTRHAAALGLAERCDSLVVVVSEERGTVSTAVDGRIQAIEPEELVERLRAHVQGRAAQSSGKVDRSRRGKLGQQLVAVFLAAFLWLAFAHRTESIQKTMVVPIEYRGLSADLIVDNPGFTHAQITVHGSEQAFDSLEPGKVAVSMDLTSTKPGEGLHELTAESIKSLPEGLRVLDLQPRQVRVSVRANVPPKAADDSNE